jgi:hypothetical protein
MPRLHLFEFEDQPWCPALLRDAATDLLRFALNLGGHYRCVAPRLQAALKACGTHQVVDLCSGGGGPWPSLLEALAPGEAAGVRLVLTDRFPNPATAAALEPLAPGRVSAWPGPVDARRLPEGLPGFRTLFTSFHHFRPEDARTILADAVAAGQGIGVFEVTQRRPLALLLMLASAPFGVLLAPFLPPWRPGKLLLLPLLPVVGFTALWDGLVSCLRTYSPEELRGLVASLPASDYRWEAGELHYWGGRSLTPVTYLIGTPPGTAPPPA